MRHTGRTHKVDFMWLHETVSNKTVSVEYIETDLMAADIFTKSFSNAAKWEGLLLLIGHLNKGAFVPRSGVRGETPSVGGKAMTSALLPPPTRRIVEFCCGEEAEMGNPLASHRGAR